MGKSIDLTGEDDVYASGLTHSDDRPAKTIGDNQIRIVSEATPVALARIFGLLSGMSIVPLSSSSSLCNDGTINLNLHLGDVSRSSSDLLRRKIYQLVETVSIVGNDLAKPY